MVSHTLKSFLFLKVFFSLRKTEFVSSLRKNKNGKRLRKKQHVQLGAVSHPRQNRFLFWERQGKKEQPWHALPSRAPLITISSRRPNIYLPYKIAKHHSRISRLSENLPTQVFSLEKKKKKMQPRFPASQKRS